MAPFLKAVPAAAATGFDLTHYTDVSGFLDKSGHAAECAVLYDTKIACSSSSARDAVLGKLASIAEHAEKEEKGTYSFWVLKSLDNDDQVRIFERYESWTALEEHEKNPALAKFWSGSKEEIKSREGRAYVPNHKGWLNRSG
jgi:quinol monooxygenase YgiN